jgi:hypothetical protein
MGVTMSHRFDQDKATLRHAWLIEQFLDWREGGPPMATNVEDNRLFTIEGVAVV